MQISCNEIVGSEVAQIKTFYSHVIGSMEGHDYVGIIFIYDFIEKLIFTSRKKYQFAQQSKRIGSSGAGCLEACRKI